MFENALLTPEEEKLLYEFVKLVRNSGKKRLFGELKGEWLTIYNTRMVGEGETLLHNHIHIFEDLRQHGFIAFDFSVPASSSILRHYVDVTSSAIERYKNSIVNNTTSKPAKPLVTVLLLAANPLDTTRLRLDREARAIDKVLRLAGFRDRFELKKHFAVQVSDLQELLLRYEPTIVHFSGHGNSESEIILDDNLGKSHPVSKQALSNLFSVLKDNIRCVVLNACYSEVQADAIAKHIDCVIGMSKSLRDSTAISFSTAFYQAIGFGRSVKTAFELGCLQIELEDLGEQDIPHLLCMNSNSDQVIFVNHS